MPAVLGAPTAQAQQATFQAYQEESGLGNLTARALLQDHKGQLWVGTDHGAYRHDGFRFHRLALPDGADRAPVVAWAEDHQRRVWLAGTEGLWMQHGPDGSWSAVTLEGRKMQVVEGPGMAALPGGDVAIALRDGSLLRARGPRLASVWQARPAEAGERAWVGGLLVVGDALWFACGEGLCNLQGDELRRWREEQGVATDRWLSLCVDVDGTIWARSARHVVALQRGAKAFIDRTPEAAVLSTSPNRVDIVADPRGGVVTRSDDGLLAWQDGHWISYTTAQGLPATLRRSLLFDREGSLWIGTSGLGVFRWLGWRDIQHWTVAEGLPHPAVWGMAEDRGGRLWFATSRGVVWLDRANGRLRAVSEPPSADSNGKPAPHTGGRVTSVVATDDGAVWYVDRERVMRVAPGSSTALVVRSWPGARGLFDDRQGGVWVADAAGVHVVPQACRESAASHPSRAGALFVVGQAEGPIFSVSSTGEVWRLADDQWAGVRYLPPDTPLPVEAVALQRDGVLWLAGGRGLRQLTMQGLQGVLSPEVDPALLGSGNVMLVFEDPLRRLWVGTDAGVAVREAGKPHWHRFDRQAGLLWNDVMSGAGMVTSSGALLVGTSAGVTELANPARLLRKSPAVRLDALSYGSQRLGSQSGPQRLPWADADLMAVLGTPDLVAAPHLQLRYRLLGLSEHWTTSRRNEQRWDSLAPGSYELQAQAVDGLGSGEASAPVSLPFVIEPPPWRSGWAMTLYALLTLAAIVVLFRWRLQARLRAQREVDRAVAMRTATMEVERAQLLRQQDELKTRADTDALTGLLNRGSLMQRLNREIADPASAGGRLAVAMVDIDHFKQVNDTHGHLAGDAVLVSFAKTLLDRLRDGDAVGRYGGEEFLLIMPGLTRTVPCERLESLNRLLARQPIDTGLERVPTLQVSASFGVAWWRPGESDTELLSRADQALYNAKRAGRKRVGYEEEQG